MHFDAYFFKSELRCVDTGYKQWKNLSMPFNVTEPSSVLQTYVSLSIATIAAKQHNRFSSNLTCTALTSGLKSYEAGVMGQLKIVCA